MRYNTTQSSEPANNNDKLLDVTEVALKFNISKRSVWRAVARSELSPPVRIGRSARWFPSDIASFEQGLREQRANPRNCKNTPK